MHGIWRDILLSEGLFGMEGKMKRLGGQITRKVDDNEIFTIRGGWTFPQRSMIPLTIKMSLNL